MRRGFTLIELLVVIAIIGILSAVVIASLNIARDKGQIGAGEAYASSVYHGIGDTMVGHWTLDDSVGGGVAADTSGYNNNCSIVGGVTAATGIYGSAFTFDGSSGYLSCGSANSVNLSTKFTITMWVKPVASAGLQTLISGDGAGDTTGAYNVYQQSNNTLQYETNNEVTLSSTGTFTMGKWQNVGVVFDSTATPNMKLYLNGTQIGGGTVTAPHAFGYLLIGRRGAGSFFAGSIDDVRMYNQALTVGDLQYLYKNELAFFSK